jgi:iron complex outermembrane receptor protein
LDVRWRPGRWEIAIDGSYSQSHRTERQRLTRLRSTNRVGYTLTYDEGSDVPSVVFNDFDVTDPAEFLNTAPNSAYARNRFATDRWDRIWAGRADVTRRFDGLLSSLAFGARYSDHHRTNDNARNADRDILVPVDGMTPAQLIGQANQRCRAPFTTSSYMEGSGTNLTRWATFDNDCLFRTFTGGDDALQLPGDSRDPSDIDVRERIFALYAMATFNGDAGSLPFSGNAGIRWADTRVTSVGYRQPYLITIDPGADAYSVTVDPRGGLVRTVARAGYRYLLPSVNVAFDLTSEVKLRIAGYRALARSGIESFGAGISLVPSTGTGTDNILFNATTGNPGLKPLRAWNADASLEWYASPDTLIAMAGYYKWIDGAVIGGVEPLPTEIAVTTTTTAANAARETRTIQINPVAPANDQRRRRIYGLEASVSHAATWLPAPFDGLGVTGSAGRTFSNVEFPDTSPLSVYLKPSPLFGLSNWVASGSLYYEKSRLSLRASFSYRSSYFKPNSGTNRSAQGSGSVDLAAQYELGPHVALKAQVLNLTGVDDVFYKGGEDSISDVSSYGPQFFAAIRLRL